MTDSPSEYDKAHITQILNGEGDWFSALLFRLIHKADDDNMRKLRQVYPDHVAAYEAWDREGMAD